MNPLRRLFLLLTAVITLTLSAQESYLPKVGGYAVGKCVVDFNGNETDNTFAMRMLRGSIEGAAFKPWIKYKLQIDCWGIPARNQPPRLLEGWLEWSRYDWLKVRVGPQKRLMGMEAFTHPFNIGSGDYTQITKKLMGLGDRSGEPLCGGYDMGVTLQGDIKMRGKHNLHYQVGIYNGQGNANLDTNPDKDLMGGLYYTPDGKLTVGIYGWDGSYGDGVELVRRRRYSYGIKYEAEWTFRAEYAHNTGGVFGKPDAPDRSSGWYATIGRNLNNWWSLFTRLETYRDDDTAQSQLTIYTLTSNFWLQRNLMLQVEYHNQRNYGHSPVSQLWTEFFIRF